MTLLVSKKATREEVAQLIGDHDAGVLMAARAKVADEMVWGAELRAGDVTPTKAQRISWGMGWDAAEKRYNSKLETIREILLNGYQCEQCQQNALGEIVGVASINHEHI